MFTDLRHRAHNQEGFTLIELLVVILIIGILAAIAIPNFLGQTAKANDASAKSNVRNAVAQMESCFTDAQTYASCNAATLQAGGLTTTDTTAKAAGGVAISTAGTASGYAVTAYSKSDNQFTITLSSGAYAYSCGNKSTNAVGKGGCVASNWGS